MGFDGWTGGSRDLDRDLTQAGPERVPDVEAAIVALLYRAATLSLGEIRALSSRALVESQRGSDSAAAVDRSTASKAVGPVHAGDLHRQSREAIARATALAKTTGGGLGPFGWATERRAAGIVESAVLALAAQEELPERVFGRLMQPWRDVVELHMSASAFERGGPVRVVAATAVFVGLIGMFGAVAVGAIAQAAGRPIDVTVPSVASVAILLLGGGLIFVWRWQMGKVADAADVRSMAATPQAPRPVPPPAAPAGQAGSTATAGVVITAEDPEGDSCLAGIAAVPGSALGLISAVGASGGTVTQNDVGLGLLLVFGWVAIGQTPGLAILALLQRLDRAGLRGGRRVRNATDVLGFVAAFVSAALFPILAYAIGGWTACLLVGFGVYPVMGLYLAFEFIRRRLTSRTA